ncbi:unnamed protein product [Cunninghamella echinulata]
MVELDEQFLKSKEFAKELENVIRTNNPNVITATFVRSTLEKHYKWGGKALHPWRDIVNSIIDKTMLKICEEQEKMDKKKKTKEAKVPDLTSDDGSNSVNEELPTKKQQRSKKSAITSKEKPQKKKKSLKKIEDSDSDIEKEDNNDDEKGKDEYDEDDEDKEEEIIKKEKKQQQKNKTITTATKKKPNATTKKAIIFSEDEDEDPSSNKKVQKKEVDTLSTINTNVSGNESDDYSSLDEGATNIKSATEKKKKPSSSTTTVKNKDDKKDSTEDDTIKRLKSYVYKCGIRKVWQREFADCSTKRAQIKKLHKILKDLGIEGRPSIEKCQKIKAERELKAEIDSLNTENILDDINDKGKPSLRSTRTSSKRRAIRSIEENSENDDDDDNDDDDQPKKRKRATLDVSFLGSDVDED